MRVDVVDGCPRCLEIAAACRHTFDIVFASYGGEFEKLIEQKGFPLRRLEPQLTPKKIDYLSRDLPIVYFAMGSSGQPAVVARIVESFAGKPYRVIAPVQRHLDGLQVTVPPNVMVTDWLPAHKVNPLADISVIHGGIGTVMTSCLAGTPIVGVSLQPEQEMTIDCLVRKGFAIRIRKGRLTPERLSAAIDRLLADPTARSRAKEYQKIVPAWDDPTRISRFFERTFPPSGATG